MNELFNKELKKDKSIYGSIFGSILLLIIAFLVITRASIGLEFQIIISIVVLLIVSITIAKSTVKTGIKLTEHTLYLESVIFGKRTSKPYDISEIRDLKYQRNVKSESYTSTGYVKVLGMDVTPESMKKYYYHHELVSFSYKGKNETIGKWKKLYDGEKLYNLINELLTKHNTTAPNNP